MKDVEIYFSLKCACGKLLSSSERVTQVVDNMAQTEFCECKNCQTRYFLHIQECRREK